MASTSMLHCRLPPASPAQPAHYGISLRGSTASSSVRVCTAAAPVRTAQHCQRRRSCSQATASQPDAAPSPSSSTQEPNQQRPGAQRQVAPRQRHSEFVHLNLDLPPPVNSRVKKASFVKSSASVGDCPPDRYPEFALIGRSNVGKSSLINSLAEQEGLARVSREPGACGRV